MNAKSRPKAALDASAVAADNIPEFTALLRDPAVAALIAYVGSISQELGYAAGFQAAERDSAAAWKGAADQVRAVLRQPTLGELRRRRGDAA